MVNGIFWLTHRSRSGTLASRGGTWQGNFMSRRPPRSTAPAAGGFLIALGLLVGGILGMTQGNAQQWLMLGAAIGVGAAVLIWLIDRRP